MTAKRTCPICNVRVIRTAKARTCHPCALIAFKKVKAKIRERRIQEKRRVARAE